MTIETKIKMDQTQHLVPVLQPLLLKQQRLRLKPAVYSSVHLYRKSDICDKTDHVLLEAPESLEPFKRKTSAQSFKRIQKWKTFIHDSAFDKAYLVIGQPLPKVEWGKLKNLSKTKRLNRSKRKLYFTDEKYSFVLNFMGLELFILSNNLETEIQFNGKRITYECINHVIKLIFGEVPVTVVRLHASVDINRSYEFTKKNIRIANKRVASTYSDGTCIKSLDSKGESVKYFLSTEYHGKKCEVTIYDSGKLHGLGENVSRVEVRLNSIRSIPIKYFHEMHLLRDGKLFNGIKLPLTTIATSKRNQEHLKNLKDYCLKESCSESYALKIIRKKNKSQADSMLRALRLGDGELFDFDEALRCGVSYFINEKISKIERRFLIAIENKLSAERLR